MVAANHNGGGDIIIIPAGSYLLTRTGIDEEAGNTVNDLLDTGFDGGGIVHYSGTVINVLDGLLGICNTTISGNTSTHPIIQVASPGYIFLISGDSYKPAFRFIAAMVAA